MYDDWFIREEEQWWGPEGPMALDSMGLFHFRNMWGVNKMYEPPRQNVYYEEDAMSEVLGGGMGGGSPMEIPREIPREAYMEKSLRRLSVTQKLEMKKRDLETELARVNAALDQLKKNPDLEAAINAVQQAL